MCLVQYEEMIQALARLTASFRKEVDDKKLPSAVMMVTRKGEAG